jgi:K+-sensing histidine kinase KdpD
MKKFFQRYRLPLQKTLLALVASGAILVVTGFASGLSSLATAETVAFVFLAVITLSAFFGNLIVSVIVSFVAALCFDYFFLPPFGTLDVSAVGDWISLGVFLLISVVISNLTASASRTKEVNANLAGALDNLAVLGRWLVGMRNDELNLAAIAAQTVEVFRFQYCSLHVYSCGKWDHAFGSARTRVADQVEDRVQRINRPLDWTVMATEADLGVRYVPIRNRDQDFAILAVKDEHATPATLVALAQLVGVRLAAT